MEKIKNNHIEDYFSTKNTKFLSLLFNTKKWKELYNQTESKISFLFTLVIMGMLYIVYQNSEFDTFMELIQNLLQIAIESSIGMLGFIISGLAIFTGTITNRLVKNINNDEKADALIGILFSFYFIGAVIGLSIVIYIVTYIIIFSNFIFRIPWFLISAFIVSYFFLYNIFYSISLLGTCLRLFFVSYKYSDEIKNDKDS